MTALIDADTDAARAVRNALEELRTLAPETLGASGTEARELAVRITEGAVLTADEIDTLMRDLRGIQPADDQLAALARGEQTVVPQATLDFLQELYGTLRSTHTSLNSKAHERKWQGEQKQWSEIPIGCRIGIRRIAHNLRVQHRTLNTRHCTALRAP